jgi:DNA-binding PadR family transcriptional regulator
MTSDAPDSTDPGSLLPLRPLVFAILLVLKSGDLHGYGIMKWINENAGLRSTLGPGTLYRTLKEMRGKGLVARADPPAEEAGKDERRSYYTLTRFGREAVVAEAERVARLMREAQMQELISKAESR